MLYIGIDGGGSTLRIGAYTATMQPVAEITKRQSANPSVIGRDPARALLQATLRDLIEQLPADETVKAVGVGIAGADSRRAREWIESVVTPIFPEAALVASADYDIALVGSLGERYGVLLLSGTGSVAFGVNRAGEATAVGGWGYIMGDEGSGYWLGLQAIKALSRVIDTHGDHTLLTQSLCDAVGVYTRDQLVDWLYRKEVAQSSYIATLAQHTLSAADKGDPTAEDIIERGAEHMHWHYRTIVNVLGMNAPPVAFAGGILGSDNALSRRLAARLGLDAPPKPKYPPVIGAALLASLSS